MRILMIRTSALGDVVHALPVLTALRRHLPDARIAWVVEGAMAPLLLGHPDLDQTIAVNLRTWRRRPFAGDTLRAVRELRAQLDAFRPDVVLDLMGNHKAGAIGALTLADRRIGFSRTARREPSSAIWISEPVTPKATHTVDRGLELLQPLGIAPEPADFGGDRLLPGLAPDTAAWLAQFDQPFALLHPGAGWGNKRYPAARWGEVASKLGAAAVMPMWVVAGSGEEPLAEEVAAASGGAARAVAVPRLDQLAALLRRASLVAGGDTGPLHLAHALGRPALFVMGPTDPARHGPYGHPERTVVHRLPCSFCYQRFTTAKACLLDIRPAEITQAAIALLAG